MSISIGPAGVTMEDKLMNLVRGWFVVYDDGTLVTEDDTNWLKVKKTKIKVLGLKWHDKFWTIRDKKNYVQFKRGSAPFNLNGGVIPPEMLRCEERCIGYYEGDKKVIYRVNDRTGKMKPEVR